MERPYYKNVPGTYFGIYWVYDWQKMEKWNCSIGNWGKQWML